MLPTARTHVLVSAAVLSVCAGSARGATLALDAPDGCVDAATLEQEVEDLVGRPLAEVPDADFRLTIAPQPGGRWHLTLQAVEHHEGTPDASHVRELDASSCAELAEAAAVAIGVAIRAFADAAPAPVQTAPPPPVIQASPPAISHATAPPQPARVPWRPSLGLAVATDTGELPGPGFGVLASAALRRRWLRMAVTLDWFPSRDTLGDNGRGGRFQLASAAAQGCFAPQWGTWGVLGCAGGELGAYWATGIGVPRPASRTTFWRAGQASFGATLALNASLALLVQATVVFPLSRSWFVLDSAMPVYVYRPDALALRMGVGLEFMF